MKEIHNKHLVVVVDTFPTVHPFRLDLNKSLIQ